PSTRDNPLALLVDRDTDTRRMYHQFLNIGQWLVDEASDGREALAKAIAMHPDVVVTETRLSGMSGYDLCSILRRDSATREIPIVVVTGDAFDTDVANARRAGADTVLIKPCLPETLLAELRRLHERSRELRARHAATRLKALEQLARSDHLLEKSNELQRRILSHVHHRHDTTTPPIQPPVLVCPQCDHTLVYRRSHIGGVSARHPEQW